MNDIEIKSLNSYYNNKKGIKNINLKVNNGEFIALLGQNGAGKTTFLNTLVGIKDFDGEIYFNYTYKDIAYVSQKQVIDWYLNVEDNIRMEEIFSDTKDEKLFNQIVELLELKDKLRDFIEELSGGQLQRVQIARAFLKNPKVYILDEPTTGLDVVLSKNILEYIKNNNKEHAVFISSHDLDLIEKYCNKIIYINDGECLYFGEMSTFLREYNKEIVYNISYNGELSKDIVEKYKDTITIVDDKNLKIFLEKEEEISNVLKLLLSENITIGSLQKEEITLKRILELEE